MNCILNDSVTYEVPWVFLEICFRFRTGGWPQAGESQTAAIFTPHPCFTDEECQRIGLLQGVFLVQPLESALIEKVDSLRTAIWIVLRTVHDTHSQQ